MVSIKSSREIELMRKVGRLAAACLEALEPLIRPGRTGLEIDRRCRDWTLEHSAIPAPLSYHGFPASLCISPNDVVCHGIPGAGKFREGDIVNLDVTPKLDGYHGDINWTFCVGAVSASTRRLVDVAYHALWAGIRQVRPGATLGDVAHAILPPDAVATVVAHDGRSSRSR